MGSHAPFMAAMGTRHCAVTVVASALAGVLGACTSVDLADDPGLGGSSGAAGQQATAGTGGGEGGQPARGSGGSSGSAGGGSGGEGGSAGAGPVECPEDDGTAAALTLAGLGLKLPEPQSSTADAGASDAGDAGADGGGTPGGGLEFEGLALPDLIGWATQPGLGTATTIGGAAGEVVTARTAEELLDYAGREEPLVIRVCGALRTPELRVSSHKTLLGVGRNATLEGGILIGGEAEYARNVIVKNLRIDTAPSTVLGEGIRIARAHHVWVDRCELFDASGDGMIDVVSGSDFVTVSWSKFHFTPDTPDPEHRFGFRIGDHNVPDEESRPLDTGHLNVTLHHNWFANDVRQRAPRVRFGKVHVFNNYYSIGDRANDYSVWASTDARVLLEGNYFHNVTNPHEVQAVDGNLLSTGNIYDGTTGTIQSTGEAFVPPYEYTPDAALTVRDSVRGGAGTQ